MGEKRYEVVAKIEIVADLGEFPDIEHATRQFEGDMWWYLEDWTERDILNFEVVEL